MNSTITHDTYILFEQAYSFFNEKLWGGELPPCAILLQRKKNAYGYCCYNKIGIKNSEEQRDEIAINPDYFERDLKCILGTLVHEMAHVWQAHFGKPSRGGYHNRQWAGEMKRIGLHPSSTGEPGGKETGQKVSHYIIDGGLFDKAYTEFVTEFVDVPQSINWFSISGGPISKAKRESKTKYTCECGLNVWAKPGANIICGECGLEMLVAQK